MQLLSKLQKVGRRINKLLLILTSVCSFLVHPSYASTHRLPDSVAYEALSDTVPFVFSPAPFKATDFEPFWIGPPISGVTFKMAENSIEWVRVAELVLVPRGRIEIQASESNIGVVRAEGFTQTFSRSSEEEVLKAAFPVALLGTSTGHSLDVELLSKKDGKTYRGRIGFRFHGERFTVAERILIDRTCSPSRIEILEQKLSKDEWVYIGCRFVIGWGEKYQMGSLENYILWSSSPSENVDFIRGGLSWGGYDLAPIRPGLYALRLQSKPGEVSLLSESRVHAENKDANSTIRYRYFLSDRFHNGFLGAGIGPYQYTFSRGDLSLSDATRPLLTLYGGFFLSEPMRIVFFNATSFDRNYFSDTGIYLNLDQFTALDGHFAFKLLLGMHTLAFPAEGKRQSNFSLPQGFELTLKDLGGKNRNLLAGAFIYPKINDRSYYNVWLRWGSSRFFSEFNYIKWSELAGEDLYESSSLGLTFGGHIWSFL